MSKYQKFKENVTEKNCNSRLDLLYFERDRVGQFIDDLVVRGYSPEKAEKEYEEICDVISHLCSFRRNHDCLLQGDPDYGKEEAV